MEETYKKWKVEETKDTKEMGQVKGNSVLAVNQRNYLVQTNNCETAEKNANVWY